MATPATLDARLFHRSAVLRLEEAEVLVDAAYSSGAVYLAGYSVECALKALILCTTSRRDVADVLQSFRGGRGHDFNWLRDLYYDRGGIPFPRSIARTFALVNNWSTDLRYVPRTVKTSEADKFLRAVREILL
jgi:hypothetical protein